MGIGGGGKNSKVKTETSRSEKQEKWQKVTVIQSGQAGRWVKKGEEGFKGGKLKRGKEEETRRRESEKEGKI